MLRDLDNQIVFLIRNGRVADRQSRIDCGQVPLLKFDVNDRPHNLRDSPDILSHL
jgi:hypothetical protein